VPRSPTRHAKFTAPIGAIIPGIVDVESFVRTLLCGRPLVLISAHYGNFELGGYLMGLFGFPTYTVARSSTIHTSTALSTNSAADRPIHPAEEGEQRADSRGRQ